MKRKGLIRILSVFVALMLPMTAMAQGAVMDLLAQAKADGKEVVTSITFEPSATLAADQLVADLSAATVLRFNKLPGGYGAFTLVLSNVDSFTALLRAQTDGLYVSSDILGDKPVYVTWDDMETLMNSDMMDGDISSNDMMPFTQSFANGFWEGFSFGKQNVEAGMELKALTEEEIKAKFIEAMGGDDSYVKWCEETFETKTVTTTGAFTLEGSDVADTKLEVTITNEDLASMFDVAYIQKQMAAQIKAQDPSLTDEQVTASLKEEVEKAKAEIIASEVSVPITIYTKGESDLVAMQVGVTGMFTASETGSFSAETTDTTVVASDTSVDENAKRKPVTFDMVYTLATVNAGKLHTIRMNGTTNEEKQFAVYASLALDDKTAVGTLKATDGKDQQKLGLDLNCNFADPKHIVGDFAITVNDGTTNTAVLFDYDQVVSDASIATKLRISNGDSIEAIKADAEKTLLGTVHVDVVVQDDSGFFAGLKEATPDTSLEIAKMSDTEMETYAKSLQSNAMQVFFKILGNLPQSVSTLLMNSTSAT